MSARNAQVLVADQFHDTTREHPAMKWMEKFTQFLNTGDTTNAAHWYSPDFVYVSPAGVETTGGKPAWMAMYAEYAHFKEYHHEPYSIVCFEADSHGCEYEMVGQAQVYGDLKGPADKVPQVTNPKDGRKWDTVRPGAWHFWYEKADDPKHEGYQMKRMHIMMDSAPVTARMMHKGVVRPEHVIDQHVKV